MSAPSLPPAFGNYVLGKDFVELSFPEAISWLPQTPGWWFVGAAILIVLARIAWRRTRQWYRDRYRREAERKLNALEKQELNADWLPELNKLLKLTALAGYPRQKVARLSGAEWVEFLNGECSEPLFVADTGAYLADKLYATHNLTQENKFKLITASRQWIFAHYGRTYD